MDGSWSRGSPGGDTGRGRFSHRSAPSSAATAEDRARSALWAQYSISAHALTSLLVLCSCLLSASLGLFVTRDMLVPLAKFSLCHLSRNSYIAHLLGAVSGVLRALNPVAIYASLKAGSITYECSYGGSLVNMLECDIKNGFNR